MGIAIQDLSFDDKSPPPRLENEIVPHRIEATDYDESKHSYAN